MATLGASLDDLDGLASQLSTTASGIDTCQASTTTSTDQVVSAVTDAARQALSAIQGHLIDLRSHVSQARSTADGANWNGSNAERFRGAAAEFDTAMQTAEGHTRDAFERFEAQIQAMANSLAEYQQSFNVALVDASGSAASMRSAVQTQRDQLDAVMNTGLSVES